MGRKNNAGVGLAETKNERKQKMKKMRTVKVKAGQEKLRERIKDALAQKGARAHIELDAIALELRHLAFQIRVLKNAKTATEEA